MTPVDLQKFDVKEIGVVLPLETWERRRHLRQALADGQIHVIVDALSARPAYRVAVATERRQCWGSFALGFALVVILAAGALREGAEQREAATRSQGAAGVSASSLGSGR